MQWKSQFSVGMSSLVGPHLEVSAVSFGVLKAFSNLDLEKAVILELCWFLASDLLIRTFFLVPSHQKHMLIKLSNKLHSKYFLIWLWYQFLHAVTVGC